MHVQTAEFVRHCSQCQHAKSYPCRKKSPLKPLAIKNAFERIQIDFGGPYALTEQGYRYILVVVDSLTSYIELFPCRTCSAQEVATILWKHIVRRYGTITEILSDRGSHFRCDLMASLTKLLGVKQSFSSAHHSQTNGKTERIIRTITEAIRVMSKKQTDWAELLPSIAMAHRSTVSTPMAISPYEALFGRPMLLSFDAKVLEEVEITDTKHDYIKQMAEQIRLTQNIVKQNMLLNASEMKRKFDQKSKQPHFAVGQMVLKHNPMTPVGSTAKLVKRWDGPYMITDISDDKYTVQLRKCLTGKVDPVYVSVDRIKPYHNGESEVAQGSDSMQASIPGPAATSRSISSVDAVVS